MMYRKTSRCTLVSFHSSLQSSVHPVCGLIYTSLCPVYSLHSGTHLEHSWTHLVHSSNARLVYSPVYTWCAVQGHIPLCNAQSSVCPVYISMSTVLSSVCPVYTSVCLVYSVQFNAHPVYTQCTVQCLSSVVYIKRIVQCTSIVQSIHCSVCPVSLCLSSPYSQNSMIVILKRNGNEQVVSSKKEE